MAFDLRRRRRGRASPPPPYWPGGPRQKRGGTLRLGRPAARPSTRRSPTNPRGWTPRVRDLRASSSATRTSPRPKERSRSPRWRQDSRGSRGREKVDIRAEADLSFPHGRTVTAANFVAAFNRDANRKLQRNARDYMHEIVGADAEIERQSTDDLGRQAAQSVRAADPHDEAGPGPVPRLTMPFFCRSRWARPPGDRRPARLRAVLRRLARPDRQVVLERNPFYRGSRPANVDRVVWTVGPGQEDAGTRSSRTRSTGASSSPSPRTGSSPATYGINRPDGRFFSTRHSRPGTSPSTTIDRRSRAGPDPAHARRSTGRSTGRRSAGLGLPRRQANRPDPAARDDPAGEHLPARRR